MTSRIRSSLLMVLCAGAGVLLALLSLSADEPTKGSLPPASTKGKMSLEEALARRRSVRRYEAGRLTREQIAQLCWAAQGVTEPRRGLRTCPSAGATYPLELFVVTADGVEQYVPAGHAMKQHLQGDVRGELQRAALNQRSVGEAPAVFVIGAVMSRTERRYSRRAERYVSIEVGHAGQNLLLQAVALGLAGVPVGAFNDEEVAKALKLPAECVPLYLLPIGVPAR